MKSNNKRQARDVNYFIIYFIKYIIKY